MKEKESSGFVGLESEPFFDQSKELLEVFEKGEDSDLDFLSSMMDKLESYNHLQLYIEKDSDKLKVISI